MKDTMHVLRAQSAELVREVNSLRADNQHLAADLATAKKEIALLRDTMQRTRRITSALTTSMQSVTHMLDGDNPLPQL